jgi:aspartyl/glutamyl-tRNA(Asn/Gln) amidotransferase C subunit
VVKIDSHLVEKVAKLSSLEMTSAEAESMATQLSRIVGHFEALRSIPDESLASVEGSPVTPLRFDRTGADTLDSLIVEANAPEFAHGHFVVPQVVSRNG